MEWWERFTGLAGQAPKIFSGKEPQKPKAPKVGEFEPYTLPWDTGAFQEKLKLYGQEQQKGIYERAAAKGTFYGTGGTMPGEIDLARQQQMALAEYQMQMEQQQMMQVYQQYLKHIEAQYGIQSDEYKYAYTEYLTRLQGMWSGQEALLGGIGKVAGTVLPFLL